jgi:hypothetical protein
MSFGNAPLWGLGLFGLAGACGELDVRGRAGFVEGAIPERGEQDADALAGEGLGMGFAAGAVSVDAPTRSPLNTPITHRT